MKKLVFSVLICLNVLYSPLWAQIPSDGLVAWYPFNGNANDESGNGNTMTNFGGVLTNNRNNSAQQAYSFVNGYTSNTSSSYNSPAFTFSAWVRPNIITNGLGDIGGTYFNYQGYFVGVSGGAPHVRVHSINPNGNIDAISSEVIQPNVWSLVTATFQGTILKIYVNGVNTGTVNTSGFQFQNREVLAIGRSPWVLNEAGASFPGSVDDVAVYNRALSTAEIQQLYQDQTGQVQQPLTCNITAPTTSLCEGESVMLSVNTTGGAGASSQLPANLQQGLVAYYPFNGNANDESGNGNNGVVNGATLTSDRFGNAGSAFSFNGQTDFIDLGDMSNSLDGLGNFSLNYWVKSGFNFDLFQGWQVGGVFSHWIYNGQPTSAIGFQTSIDFQSRIALSVVGGEGDYSNQVLNSNIYNFVSVIFDGTRPSGERFSLYLNGNFIEYILPPTSVQQFGNVGNKTVIGGYIGYDGVDNVYFYFKGILDDISIYNKSLSLTEIQQLFTAQSYAWSNNATTPTITVTPTQNTTYSCTVTHGNQTCTASLDITVNPTITNTISATIIEGETYTIGTQTLTTAGTYTEVFTSSAGCDSTVTLALSVEPLLTCEINAPATTLCEGESVTLSVNTTGGAGASSQLPANLQQGLVAYYPFNGNANDESGNGNDGVVNGATLTSDRFGNAGSAYYFNGLTFIESNVNSIPLANNPRTISGWFKPEVISGGFNMFYSYGDYSPTNLFSFGIYENSANLYFSSHSNDVSCYQAQLNTYYHVVVVYDGSNYNIYINNVLSCSGIIPTNTTGNILYIGKDAEPSNSTGLMGIADDIFIYNRALSPSEIQQLYTAQSYAWSTGATTPTITVSPTEDTTYSCTVTQGNQACTASVDITVNPNVTNAISATIIEGETYTLGTQTLTTEGTYTEVFTSAAGCDSTVTLTLSVEPLLTCEINAPTTTLCEGEPVTLSVNTTGGAAASSQLPANLQQGLVAYYPFNGNANDESGNGNDGTVNGATLTADRYGNVGSAYDFNGNGQYISVPNSDIINPAEITLSSWFYVSNSFTAGNLTILSKMNHNSASNFSYGIGLDSLTYKKRIGFSLVGCSNIEGYGGDGSNKVQYSSIGQWHLFTGTISSSGFVQFYLDGQYFYSYQGENFYPCNDVISVLHIGHWWNYDNQWFLGSLDDIAIYNRALSPAEIQQLYTAQSYAWSTNAATPTISVSPTQNTTYTCTVTTATQTCTDEITITVNPLLTWYADADGDGFGNANSTTQACDQPTGFVADNTDCNDNINTTYPNAEEICFDQIDNNCNVNVDENCAIFGCINPNACNFNPQANTDDGSCVIAQQYYNCDGICINDSDSDGVCDELEILGCTDPTAFNYNPQATNDDGSCEAVLNCVVSGPVSICQGQSAQLSQINVPFQSNQVKSVQSDAVFSYGVPISAFDPTNTQNNFTYEFWANPTSTIGSFPSPAQGCSNSSLNLFNTSQKWVLFPNNNGNDLGLGVSVGTNGVLVGTHANFHLASRLAYPGNLQGWNHIAVSVQNKNVSLYINGVLVATTVNTASCNLRPSFSVGVDLSQGPYGRSFIGKFSNVRIWNAPLTVEEINFVKDKVLENNANTGKSFFRIDLENLTNQGSSNLLITTYGTPILQDFALTGGAYAWNGTVSNSTNLPAGGQDVNVAWSNGMMTQNITVSPTQTTTYTATATTATQTCTDEITITVNPLLTWYADADGDGFGNAISTTQACDQPEGYTADNTDCNDTDATVFPNAEEICFDGMDNNCNGIVDENCAIYGCINPNACNFNPQANTDDGSCILPQPEVCNNLDDNCNNQVDEGLAFVNYYNDNDGDGQGTGTAINACASPGTSYVTSTGDCNDNNNAINSNATEICDALDNDCDGQINEGLMPGDISFVNVNTALFPTCSSNNLFSANLNNGSNSAIIDGTGPDLWYKLTAQHNTLRAGLSAASGSNSVGIYQDLGGCLQLLQSESETTTGNQTLLTDALQVGATYYIAVHQIATPTNTSAKICFNHFVPSTCDHVYSANTGVYSNVCLSFKAQFKANASNYIFNVLSATQNGSNLNITPWSYTSPTASSIVTRLGTLLPANMSASNRVYTINVPVVYNLPDAAGNISSLTANATSTCTVTLQPETGVTLRTTDRCPNIKAINQSIATDRSICGTLRYEWEFTQTAPTLQAPVTVLGGLNSTALFLNTVPGMGNGKTYNVRVRPIHTTGEVGNYGAVQCMKTTGAGMILENHPGSAGAELPLLSLRAGGEMVSLFPNPTVDGQVTLLWKESQEGSKELVLRDVQGRIVWRQKVVIEGNVLELDWKTLDTGIYLLEVDGQTMRVVKG